MKTIYLFVAAFSVSCVGLLCLNPGCSDSNTSYNSHEISHTEKDKKGWFGGQTHEVNTVYRNADGTTSVETETRTTNGDKTTITREKKTTNLDGTVKTEKETRTVVAGSDNVERESKVTNGG